MGVRTPQQALARARPGRRLSFLLVGYLLLTTAVAWRLFTVQVVGASELRELAAAQTQRELILPARRGTLYDRGGEPLAMSVSAATIYTNPGALATADTDPKVIAEALAPLLDRHAVDIAADLRKDAGFVYLARQRPRAVGEQVRAMQLPGIGVLEEPTRVYPAGSLAAQVVGFVGIDNVGLSGLELQYDDVLAGEPGTSRIERAPRGLVISTAPHEVTPPVPGTDLVLTIDRQIQYAAEQALMEAVAEYDAIGGSAVVLDARTAEVLAMASVPSFDPKRISDSTAYTRRNRAVTDVYEPGSVNKAITAAAALEEGLVSPREVFVLPEHVQVGPKRFSDPHRSASEPLTFAEIIAQSSNVGTIKVAQRLGAEGLDAYLRDFGFGSESGLGFPGESGGLLPPVERWWATSLPTIAIGQGVSATLLQVAEVFQTIAAGGEHVAPALVRGTVGADGRLQAADPAARRRVVSEATASAVAELLVGVVESGTGERAAVPGYRVGGKTGTAQKPLEHTRGYEPDAYIASFAGFAPAEDPALVVAVMLDEPTPHGGGVVAAPVFSEIMEFALAHRRVPPSAAG